MLRHFELVISAVVGSSSLSFQQSSVPANVFVSFQVMPLKITPSKSPLPVAKRSSLRNRSYEVEPIPGRKVYPSRFALISTAYSPSTFVRPRGCCVSDIAFSFAFRSCAISSRDCAGKFIGSSSQRLALRSLAISSRDCAGNVSE